MKTNRFARTFLKIRVILFCLSVLGMAGVGFRMGDTLTVRFGQTAALPPQTPQAPNLSSDFGRLIDDPFRTVDGPRG